MAPEQREPLLDKGAILNGKWEILGHIASGGMAEVYRARQINLDREVAVKILSQQFLDSLEEDEEEIQSALGRFHREVRVMAVVRHPNVLQVYDQDRTVLQLNGKELNIEYIVMEYIAGPDLRSTMPPEGLRGDDKGLSEWILRYYLPILDGVETVHALGIVHRDLKPQNMLLDEFTPKIMDFGLAGGRRWEGLTQDHHMLGTIQYMAPEQLIDMTETDARGDIYSLGKILYEAVSGEMTRETSFPLKTASLADPDTPLLRRLDRIIQRATAEKTSDRIPSVGVLKELVNEAVQSPEEPDDRMQKRLPERTSIKRGWLYSALLLMAIGVSIGFHLLYHREKASQPILETIQPTTDVAKAPIQDSKEQAQMPDTSKAPPPATLQGEDGATLCFVPGGEVLFPEHFKALAGQSVKVASIYMDATEVTNHQYVEFLNQVLPEIRVEGGVVKGGDRIWLLLGEVVEGYEPIVFRNGRFHIREAGFASDPVVRVTGHGAQAYAGFYGRRLPTEAEWLLASGGEKQSSGGPPEMGHATSTESDSDATTGMSGMHQEMHSSTQITKEPPRIPLPVVHYAPNAYGLRGLDTNVKEWGLQFAQRAGEESPYVILPTAVRRYPWEAFADVGFRCARSIGDS